MAEVAAPTAVLFIVLVRDGDLVGAFLGEEQSLALVGHRAGF